jgi:DNA modification methylase
MGGGIFRTKLFSKKGSIVVDPFLGSGTTALACKNTERKCLGIELNTEYYEIDEQGNRTKFRKP